MAASKEALSEFLRAMQAYIAGEGPLPTHPDFARPPAECGDRRHHLYCERPKGHSGEHRALDRADMVAWPRPRKDGAA